MSKAAFTIHCFGVYLMGAGVVSFFAGPWLLPALQLPGPDVWWRCFGALVAILGAYYVVAARCEVPPLFRAMAWGRLAFALFLGVEAALHQTPVLLGFVVLDVLGALWTLRALKAARVVPVSSEPSGVPSSRSRTARDAWRLREPRA